jgi:hypothetical protein
MTACFTRPTPQTLWSQITSWFSSNVLGGAPIIPESNEYYLCGNDLAAMELYYSLSQQQWNETQDATACCDSLIKNNAPLGLVPYGATFCQGYVTVTGGPPNDPIPNDLQIQVGSNTLNISQATNANPTNLDGSGDATLLFQSLVPGASVNASINLAITQLGTVTSVSATILNIPNGWPSNVTPNGQFCGGADAELCEAFRTRVIARKKTPQNATLEKIVEYALSYPCVTRVYQRTCGPCCADGQLQLYAFMDNSFEYGIPPSSALAGLATFIFGSPQGYGLGKAPVGIFGNFFVVNPVTLNINFFNMGCVTPSQFALIQKLIGQLFATLTPGQTVCGKWIDAIVISVNPNCCNYTIQVTPSVTGLGAVDCFGDFVPHCDILPVIGTIEYSAQLASVL